jgi:predicted methyltransferase
LTLHPNHRLIQTAIAVVLAVAFTISGSAQDCLAQSGTATAAFPKPDRPIADIVSPIWHNEKERDDAGEPRQLVRLLAIKPGMTVADIGAGSGYHAVRLSEIVGARGRVIAEDVVPEYLRSLRKRVRDLGLQNVSISEGEPHDPKLPAGSLDIAILVHMYHEIAQPYTLLYNLVPALKPGGRVGIVDDGQRRLSRDFRPAVGCNPHAAGSDGRVQRAVALSPWEDTFGFHLAGMVGHDFSSSPVR